MTDKAGCGFADAKSELIISIKIMIRNLASV